MLKASGLHDASGKLVREDGRIRDIGVTGPILGAWSDAALVERSVRIDPDETLFLFTDGVVDTRGEYERFGINRLKRVLTEHAGLPPEALLVELEHALANFQQHAQFDDTAAVALRPCLVEPEPSSPLTPAGSPLRTLPGVTERTGNVRTVPDFQIDIEETEPGATLKLAGELDGAAADVVIAQFDRAVDAGCQQVTVDLAGVSFIDSAGLRAILLIQRRMAERDLSLIVVPPPEPLLDLLEITGLTERLALAPQQATSSPEQRFLERVDLELRRDPQAPGQARGKVRQAIERRLTEVELATAVLLTSELVTNAVVHPPPDDGKPIELRISSYPDRVRVEVFDSGGGFNPEALPKSPPETGGRGLMVVDRLASRWGIDHDGDGGRFCVWYELEPESAES